MMVPFLPGTTQSTALPLNQKRYSTSSFIYVCFSLSLFLSFLLSDPTLRYKNCLSDVMDFPGNAGRKEKKRGKLSSFLLYTSPDDGTYIHSNVRHQSSVSFFLRFFSLLYSMVCWVADCSAALRSSKPIITHTSAQQIGKAGSSSIRPRSLKISVD